MVLELANLLFSGLLAGAEYVVRLGLRDALNVLEERPQIELRQALVYRLRVVVPAVFVPTALTSIAVAAMEGGQAGVAFRALAIVALIAWTLTTFLGTVPINSALIEWRADAPPADWRATIARWERLDTLRFVAAAAVFAGFLLSLGARLGGR